MKLADHAPRFPPATPAQKADVARRCGAAAAATGLVRPCILDWLEDAAIPWRLHEGDLLLPGSAEGGIALVVDGDLVVHGTYDDYPGRSAGLLLCLGSMRAQHVVSWGALFVAGDLSVRGLVHASCNDWSIEVLGTAGARMLVVQDKSCFAPRVDAELHVDAELAAGAVAHAATLARAATLLVPELLETEEGSEGEVGFERVQQLLRRGGDPFRERPASSPPAPPADVAAARREIWRGRPDATRLAELAADPALRRDVAASPHATASLLGRLAQDRDPRVRASVASHGSSDEESLAGMALDEDATVLLALAGNPGCPEAALAALAASPHDAVRHAVAVRPAPLPPDVAAALAGDPAGSVRRGLAGNPGLPAALVARLVEDADEVVRDRAVGTLLRRAGDPASRQRLATDPSEAVRAGVAARARAGEAPFAGDRRAALRILEVLLRDPAPGVRRAAAATWLPCAHYERHGAAFVADPEPAVRAMLAARGRRPEWLLVLAGDPSGEVRVSVAQNPNLPPEGFVAIASTLDPGSSADDARLVELLADNPSLPAEAIRILHARAPQQAPLDHPHAPLDLVIARLAAGGPFGPTALDEMRRLSPAEQLAHLASSEQPERRRAAALCPATPASVLRRLASPREEDWVRDALARNPSLPPDLLSALARDEESRLRARIAVHPACPRQLLWNLACDESSRVAARARWALALRHGEDR